MYIYICVNIYVNIYVYMYISCIYVYAAVRPVGLMRGGYFESIEVFCFELCVLCMILNQNGFTKRCVLTL